MYLKDVVRLEPVAPGHFADKSRSEPSSDHPCTLPHIFFSLHVQLEKQKHTSSQDMSFVKFFSDKYIRRPLVITVGLQMAQQLTGINGVSETFFFFCVNKRTFVTKVVNGKIQIE